MVLLLLVLLLMLMLMMMLVRLVFGARVSIIVHLDGDVRRWRVLEVRVLDV